MKHNPSRPAVRDFRRQAKVKRIWLLVPKKKNLYVPGFEGTFYEAFAAAQARARSNKTSYEIWEADPVKYRFGGMIKRWATAH
ncbi:MAG TPA: hypothetical protein VF905_09500 [Nitrospirota bacterium]